MNKNSAQLTAVFIVTFDTKLGNRIEFQIPDDVDLTGVEFKALPSGFHLVDKDFIYFRKNEYYGVAAFERLLVESIEERNVRMKSVCVLAKDLNYLYKNLDSISKLVKKNLQAPNDYANIVEFWSENNTFTLDTSGYPILENRFKTFYEKFQVNIFLIWKYSLLNKRILFYDTPECLGKSCTYCSCCLDMCKLNIENIDQKQMLKCLFYVNVNEIEFLKNESSYVACTTDRLFESMIQMYDLLVNKSELRFFNSNSKISKINRADQRRFQELKKKIESTRYSSQTNSFLTNKDEIFQAYFLELNTQIFKTLLEVEQAPSRKLTPDHIKQMTLDPSDDRDFLLELTKFYNLNISM